jgi:hypothetical protein
MVVARVHFTIRRSLRERFLARYRLLGRAQEPNYAQEIALLYATPPTMYRPFDVTNDLSTPGYLQATQTMSD